MKCGACKFDDDNAREEDGFVRVEPHTVGGVTGRFPMHEAPGVTEQVGIWACPKCGTLRIESWRLRGEG